MARPQIFRVGIKEHIKKWSAADLKRGYTDCLMFSGEWVKSQGGPDIYSQWKYSNEFGAWRLIFKNGFRTLNEYLDSIMIRIADPIEACLILCESKTKLPAMGIYHNNLCWIFGEDGKIWGSEVKIIGAWTWQQV